MLLDEFLPVYEVSDAVATIVEADRNATWDALMQVDSLSVRALDTRRTLLSGTMRTATTNTRRWFRRYWTFGVGSGAHVLVNGLIDVVRENAEQCNQHLEGADPVMADAAGVRLGTDLARTETDLSRRDARTMRLIKGAA